MPKYKVTNPATKQVLRIIGTRPPTEAELNDIFAATSTRSLQGTPRQTPVPGVGSERRVIEPSLTRTPGQAQWEGFKSGALEGGKELLEGASAGLNQLVAAPAYNAAVALGFHPDKASYQSQTTAPDTFSGRIGSALPTLGAIASGVAELGWVPTAAGLASGIAAGEVAKEATDYALPTDIDPERRAAIVDLANLTGMAVGGVGGTATMRSPMGQRAIASVGKAAQGTLQERAAAASLGALAGYEVAGPKTAAAGGAFGAVFPNVVIKRPRAILADWAKGVLTEASETATRESKAKLTIPEQRAATGQAGVQLAQQLSQLDAIEPSKVSGYKKTLNAAIEAKAAAGADIEAALLQQQQRLTKIEAGSKLPKISTAVQDTLDTYGPEGLAGRVELVPDAVAKRDYIATQKHLNTYVEAGEQPPTGLVELFDRLRERVVATNKAVSANAYDAATASLVDAAAQGPKAYANALAALPKQTRTLLQNVDASLLNTLQSRSRNAGGTLGKPAADPWFTLMNDVLGEWARPQSVEVPVESLGGSATVPSGIDVMRVPGAAVSVPAVPAATAVETQAVAGQPAVVSAEPPSINSASARAQKRGGSVLGYNTNLPRQHNAQTLSTAARMLQLAHDITTVREANPKAFIQGTVEYATKNEALDASLAEYERLAHLFAGRGKLLPFATTRQRIPNVGTVNGWISNSTELTPAMKRRLGVATPTKD